MGLPEAALPQALVKDLGSWPFSFVQADSALGLGL